jgi:hypothetical protein
MNKKDKNINIGTELKPDKVNSKNPNQRGDFRELNIGVGDKVIHADRQGFWIGANKFSDAPFAVDIDGKLYINGVLHP